MILRQLPPQLRRFRIPPPNRSLLNSPARDRRQFTTTAHAMVEVQDISPSAGENLETLAQQTTDLVDHGRWRICNEGKGLERLFTFKTFKATWEFMDAVAAECKVQKHHPEWTNVYNRTHVRWTTHKPLGLSGKDVSMARFCDGVAQEKGEVAVEVGDVEGLEGSLERVEGRECCSGKT